MESPIIDEELNQKNKHVPKAGFWIRVVAAIIDIFVYAPFIAFNFYNLIFLKNLPIQLFMFAITIVYKPFMEYKFGATLGKMAVNIKVVDYYYGKISASQAIVRYTPWLFNYSISITSTILLFNTPEFQDVSNFMEIGQLQQKMVSPLLSTLSSSVLFLAIIPIPFNKNKKGLHDMLASTYCVYKSNKE